MDDQLDRDQIRQVVAATRMTFGRQGDRAQGHPRPAVAQSKRAEASWWEQWAAWLAESSDAKRAAAPAIGTPALGLGPLGPAPGT